VNTVVTGNTSGLKPSELHALERVFRRRVRPEEVVSAELGAFLCELSRDIQRQIGLFVNRRGEIEHVFVGDASRLELPEIGRLRAGRGRFRGLRLVHTHLRNEPLTRDDLVDLALLRLDLVAAVGMHPDGRPADLHVAHLLPSAPGQSPSVAPWLILASEPFHKSRLDARAIIQALEEEFERVSGVAIATDGRDRALLVVVELKRRNLPGQQSRIDELKELCRTAGVRVRGIA
jgi:GTP-binding protein HflX